MSVEKIENFFEESEQFKKIKSLINLKSFFKIEEFEKLKNLINKINSIEELTQVEEELKKSDRVMLYNLIKEMKNKCIDNINFIVIETLINSGEVLENSKDIERYLNKINLEDIKIRKYKENIEEIKKNLKDLKNKKMKEYLKSTMILVKGGKYKPSFFDEEREVFDIAVCKYQTTQDMYEKIMGENPSEFKGGRNPVEKVSWWDALKYCNKLSEEEGLEPVYNIDENGNLKINQLDGEVVYPDLADFRKTEGYRLPTELEWEWFARGGNIAIQNGTFDTKYAGSENIDEVAWYNENSGSKTHAVGTKKANELGLYDCTGNVWEWCYDTYSDVYISEQNSYIYDARVSTRRLRGCSWYISSYYCGLLYRNWGEASRYYYNYGFRLVRTV